MGRAGRRGLESRTKGFFGHKRASDREAFREARDGLRDERDGSPGRDPGMVCLEAAALILGLIALALRKRSRPVQSVGQILHEIEHPTR